MQRKINYKQILVLSSLLSVTAMGTYETDVKAAEQAEVETVESAQTETATETSVEEAPAVAQAEAVENTEATEVNQNEQTTDQVESEAVATEEAPATEESAEVTTEAPVEEETVVEAEPVVEEADGQMNLINRVQLGDYGIEASDLTSVAVHPSGEYIAISAPAVEKTDNGLVAFFDAMGEYINQLTVGALPDMVTFTNDGKYALVANEGEPNDDYTVNPEGSVSVIKLDKAVAELTDEDVRNVPVTADVLPEEVRPLGLTEADYPLNYEPEYIVADDNNEFAYVSFQEASAIGKLDIANGEWVEITNMGYKDHSIVGNGLDASDRDDAINIVNWPVLGMYHPDGIDVFDVDGESYIITANEGDSQDYDGYSEETRVKDLAKDGLIDLKAEYYEGYTQEELDALVANGLFDDDQLGRLTVTTAHPFIDENGMHNALVALGGRSFSIIRASDMSIVFDSGDQFEQIIANELPEYFNHDIEGETWDDVSVDGRSDNKGPETESVIVGRVNGQQYAFIASERTGGFFIYNVSNAENPQYVDYIYDPSLTNISPEGLEFVSAEDSATGQPMLIMAHELSGTITSFNLTSLLPEVEEGSLETPGKEGQDNTPSENNNETEEADKGDQSDTTTPVTGGSDDNKSDQDAGKGSAKSSKVGQLSDKADSKSGKNNPASQEVAVDKAGLPATGYAGNSVFGTLAVALLAVGTFLIKPFKKH